MNCEFIKQGDEFVCKKCGFATKLEGMKINCRNIPPRKEPRKAKDPPGLIQRGLNLAKASFSHFKEGFHHCGQEERVERYKICSSNKCGLFLRHGDGGICSHDDCGCFIRSNGRFMDKLSWAESKCPEGYWGPVDKKDGKIPENGV